MDNNESINSNLSEIFSEVGKKYGYDEVSAEYAPFVEFKVKWQRCNKMAAFRVSDYLIGADASALSDMADVIFSRIASGHHCPYPDSVMSYLLGSEIVKMHQATYMRRTRIQSDPELDLKVSESYSRLVSMGLVTEGACPMVGWMKTKCGCAGVAAVTMNVIGISDVFKDMENIPDNVFDYILYAQIVRIDRNPETTSLGSDTPKPATKYPGLQEAQDWLLKAVKIDA